MGATENHHIKKNTPHWFYLMCLIVGITCMVVAGYFLVVSVPGFSGDATTRTILAGGAVLFHLVETLCFVGAAGFAFHSRRWRFSLFGMGCVLFVIGLFAMTLAQKTAMQSGETQAEIIDGQVVHLEKKIASYDKLISRYESNAEKQSRSKDKDSLALGQDSLNKAAEFEEKKMKLTDELVEIKGRGRQTSRVVFDKLAILTGYNAVDLEWALMIAGSLLFQLSGIFLMLFGVSHRGEQKNHARSKKEQSDSRIVPMQDFGRRVRDFIDTTQVPVLNIAARYSKQGVEKRSKGKTTNVPTGRKIVPVQSETPKVIDLDQPRKRLMLEGLDPRAQKLVKQAVALFKDKEIKKLTRENVRKALSIKTREAGIVTKAAKQYIKYFDTALEH